MDAESLRAQQAEQRKLVEQQKKQRAAEHGEATQALIPRRASGPHERPYSVVNWIWCQPVAPEGNTLVRRSGWVSPFRSVARTWARCSPAGPS